MQLEQSFEVVVRRKVPYVTSFFFHMLVIFGLILLIIDFFFLPTLHASDEMKVAYFILVIPDFVKNALYISGIGFLAVLPLYISARFYRKAVLTFLTDNIVIQGEKINTEIPINSINRVFCMDSHSIDGQSSEKLTIYFQQKGDKTTRVRLRNYIQADEFMTRLMQYENVDFRMYDFNISPDPENEE
jgi:hypothetical protein